MVTYQVFASLVGMNGAIIVITQRSSPSTKEVLGWILGPAKGEGNEMAQWVLKANGNVVPQHTARPLTVAETHLTTELKKQGTFDALVEKQWGTSMSPPPVPKDDDELVLMNTKMTMRTSKLYLK